MNKMFTIKQRAEGLANLLRDRQADIDSRTRAGTLDEGEGTSLFGQAADFISALMQPTSPWIWTEDAQPPLGEKVIFADTDDARRNITQIGTTVREDDWGMGTDEPCRCYWMHIPPLPEGGLLGGQESPGTRVGIGHEGGHQQLPEDGALANKIAAIMQQWVGTNGGVYAIRGCAMEIARELQGATTSGDEQAAFTTWAEVEYRNEASYTARDYRMGLEAWRRRALVDRSPNLQSSAVDESEEMQIRYAEGAGAVLWQARDSVVGHWHIQYSEPPPGLWRYVRPLYAGRQKEAP